jgi:hypothetical protein
MAITSARAHQPRGEDRPVATMRCSGRPPGSAAIMGCATESKPTRRTGSARGYLGRWRARQQSLYDLLHDRLHRIFIHRHPWGECPHLAPLYVKALLGERLG